MHRRASGWLDKSVVKRISAAALSPLKWGTGFLRRFSITGMMDGSLFEFRFSNQLLLSLEQGTAIIAGSASFHSKRRLFVASQNAGMNASPLNFMILALRAAISCLLPAICDLTPAWKISWFLRYRQGTCQSLRPYILRIIHFAQFDGIHVRFASLPTRRCFIHSKTRISPSHP